MVSKKRDCNSSYKTGIFRAFSQLNIPLTTKGNKNLYHGEYAIGKHTVEGGCQVFCIHHALSICQMNLNQIFYCKISTRM